METEYYIIKPLDGYSLVGDYVDNDERNTSISYDNIDAVLRVVQDQLKAGVHLEITIDTFYEEQQITF